jgi:hypothetical protein
MIVVHPESSWLQCLVELGALPVLAGIVALVIFVIPRVRELFSANRTIFLRAGAFGAAAILIVHSLFDVPGHRWGTAGFALAALAVACAPTERERFLLPNRRAALVPAAIAVFWALPILWEMPAWSPTSLNRLLTRDYMTPHVTTAELQRAVGYFHSIRCCTRPSACTNSRAPMAARSRDWQQHFRIAMSWPRAHGRRRDQARACINVSPGIALHYWQVAIEGAGHRASEVFGMAMKETVRIPGATEAWRQYAEEAWLQYAESHPPLLLAYAAFAPESTARVAFDHWWKQRGAMTADLTDDEVQGFYNFVVHWGKPEQLALFQQHHPELKTRDFKQWAFNLHEWKKDKEAWQLIASEVPEPNFTGIPPRSDLARLKEGWKLDKRQFVNARDYAAVLTMEAKLDPKREVDSLNLAREVVVTVADYGDAPDWFVRKGAHLLAAQGEFEKAVTLYLKPRKPTGPPAP